jgi:hypothetical protein
MANIRLLYMTTGAYHKNALDTDTLLIGKIQAAGVGGVSFDAGGGSVVGLAAPVNANDAVTKAYADQLISGLSVKSPVRAATVGGNIGLAGTAPNTLDGVTLALNDRILVKDQTTASQNGIYTVTTLGTGANGTWTRATDADSNAEVVSGTYAYVDEGTANADSGWVLTTNNPITLGTTSLVFTQFSGLGQINAGNGLTKTGNTLNVVGGLGITANADDVAINLDATPGLLFNSGALKVKVDSTRAIGLDSAGVFLGLNGTNPGLAFTSTYVDVKYNAAGAIVASATGIALNLETVTPSLAITSNKLDVKLDGARAITAGASGLGLNLAGTNPGLAITTNALDVKYNAAGAIVASATGITLNLATTNPSLAITTNQLDVKYNAAGAIVGSATGITLNLESSNPSLQIATNQLGIKFDANGGLQKVAAGTGIKLNGSTLSLGASGIAVLGVPSLFTVNGSAVSANVTAAALTTLTGGGTTNLHFHDNQFLSTFVAAAGGLTAGNVVYVSTAGANTAAKADNTADATSQVIGICTTTAAAAAATTVQVGGVVTTGATHAVGDTVFLGTAGGYVTYSGLASGARVIRLGWAVSTTQIVISIMDYGEKP